MTDSSSVLAPGLQRLVAWIEDETGLCFPEVHHETILKTARNRCSELKLSPEEYEGILYRDAAEKCRFFNEVTIGETYFFRDEKHFSILVSYVLPELMLQRRELRIWSATCASGEEALSLLATVEHVKDNLQLDTPYTILASDINKNGLDKLRQGVYPSSSFRNDGKIWHRLLDSCGAMDGIVWQASAESLSHIELRHLNLLSGDLPPPNSLDVVFFRNTLVYMKQAQKDKAIARIIGTMRPGAYLFLASPEVPTIRHPRLEVMERNGGFFFRKLAADAQPGGARHKAVAPIKFRDPAAATTTTATAGPVAPLSKRNSPERKSRPLISGAQLAAGLELASVWAANPKLRPISAEGAPSAEDSPSAEVAEMIDGIIEALHANRFSLADGLLEKFEARARENQVSQYLQAMSQKHQGNAAAALDLWERARVYEPKFWPALFQAGMAYVETDPARSRSLLKECLEVLESAADENKYAILLEGFDASYYRRMAEKMYARLKAK